MKVYKFGGTSVKSADGIRNIVKIVATVKDDLFIVVSAMGKTTNALEVVLDHFMKADKSAAIKAFSEVEIYHEEIIQNLFSNSKLVTSKVNLVFTELKSYIINGLGDNYDRCYDHIVSYGEVISTLIVSEFLKLQQIDNCWVDMRKLLVTDSNFREANIRMENSATRMQNTVDFSKHKIYLGQGFIGANMNGDPTTLGREGSDFSAALIANLLNAESVTIWKDVPGILNADPRIFPNTTLIPELRYLDAVELAYSGAQIIHPKTIKPLENKNIPLYVRPFGSPTEKGSVIHGTLVKQIDVPILILRKNQVLITIRPHDFSFVLEESLSKAFVIMHKNRLKVSLIQSSAISISVCVDDSRYLQTAIDELGNEFNVNYNTGLELLTIRGVNNEIISETTKDRNVLLSQKTRRTARFLMKEL